MGTKRVHSRKRSVQYGGFFDKLGFVSENVKKWVLKSSLYTDHMSSSDIRTISIETDFPIYKFLQLFEAIIPEFNFFLKNIAVSKI